MDLKDLREGIDSIDNQILDLLNKRAHFVKEIGRIKLNHQAELYVPSREQAIFERLEERNDGPFPSDSVFKVFREIISASLALEHPIKVAYLGPRATFTHVAALKQFGRSALLEPTKSIPAIFTEVASKRAHYGVVPVENSNEGAVTHTLDMFMESDLKIIAENYVEVSHDLLSTAHDLSEVKTIYSHPQALEQCRLWIADHCPNAVVTAVSSTAAAAQMVAEEHDSAAIASPAAGEIYNLRTLAAHIEDHPNNYTRFLVIGSKTTNPTGNDRTSILFSFKDQPGILSRMLEPFSRNKLNLAKIESRPVKKKAWEYVFYLDIEGHIEQPEVARAIEELGEFCSLVKHLGSYPLAR